jgi:anthranilate synthase
MTFDFHRYQTDGGIRVSRSVAEVDQNTAIENVLSQLNAQRGAFLSSSYEYPGRYKRWAIGFVNPPLELSTRGSTFKLTAHNQRGKLLLPLLADRLQRQPQVQHVQWAEGTEGTVEGTIAPVTQLFAEEERSQQPSVFSVVRTLLDLFASPEDEHLGLYGAFGYDLVFQFEPIQQALQRPAGQRDLVLYLPDELIVVDYYLQKTVRYTYEFETANGSTSGLARTGEVIDYQGSHAPTGPQGKKDTRTQGVPSIPAPGAYAAQVEEAKKYFCRGDLFEVVLSQQFSASCSASPVQLFQTLQQINPSPYGFLFNLGGEYLIGASPEMFVRVEGKRVETCPISGTILRGQDAIGDAEQIRQLLNSYKDETELTMCTDVDRNDKSRVCIPGSVKVIGRRQIELYSHVIHTVDHVEGILRPEFDALDAFLSHTWAVTVTGAPKRAAMQFIECHEESARRWYGGAVGRLTFNGDMHTGLTLRTIRFQNAVAEIRVGATLLYDSVPMDEAQETLTKAAALFETLNKAAAGAAVPQKGSRGVRAVSSKAQTRSVTGKRVLLIDYEDSFVHTLANYIRQTGATVTTLRHGFPVETFERERPDLVVLSPGPGRPNDFQVPQTVQACLQRQIPLFGVCLGLQGIVEALGGTLGVLNPPQHGKSSELRVTDPDSKLFQGLPETFPIGRYHSLYALPEQLPPELKVTALSHDNVIMALEHRSLPVAAVQFHPESIMTLAGDVGLTIVQNVLQTYVPTPTAFTAAGTRPTVVR